MDRLVSVGLFSCQGPTGTHNLTPEQNTIEGRRNIGIGRGGNNIDYRGKVGSIFEGMQFIYNDETGALVTDEVNKGTFDYCSPFAKIPYFSHKGYDIETWIEWGTGGADNPNEVIMPSELWNQVDRILTLYESGSIKKKEAQRRIESLLPEPPEVPNTIRSGVEQ